MVYAGPKPFSERTLTNGTLAPLLNAYLSLLFYRYAKLRRYFVPPCFSWVCNRPNSLSFIGALFTAPVLISSNFCKGVTETTMSFLLSTHRPQASLVEFAEELFWLSFNGSLGSVLVKPCILSTTALTKGH